MQSRQVYETVVYTNKSSHHQNNNRQMQSTENSEVRLDLLKTFNDMNVTLSLATCEVDDEFASPSSTHYHGNNDNNNPEDDNPLKCCQDDSIIYTMNTSNTIADSSNNQHKRRKHRLLIGKEKCRNFFISYEFWIFIVPFLMTVTFVIFLSFTFGYAFISKNESKVDEIKEPGGSQSKF
ncbi:unnamed protein product [Trichobilharzia szidati]|nr:unnamed protein product [Trichobilharzia szidati]